MSADGVKLKVWWLLAGERYYPGWDNFVASFETEQEAEAEAREVEKKLGWGWTYVINIEGRL